MGNCLCFICVKRSNTNLIETEVSNVAVQENCENSQRRNSIVLENDDNNVQIHHNLGYDDEGPIFYIEPGSPCPLSQLNHEDQICIAKRMGMLQQIPLESFTLSMNLITNECIICMCDYVVGEEIRFLPCLHTFHRACIDCWLMRSFVCPSCLVPVEPALLSALQSN